LFWAAEAYRFRMMQNVASILKTAAEGQLIQDAITHHNIQHRFSDF
jgi:hypothetical protein